MMTRFVRIAAFAAALLAASAAFPPHTSGEHEPSVKLVWHAESRTGDVIDSRDATTSINPASVVKVATTLWALERLGPDHRFETRFAGRGAFEPKTGILDGDLVVHGGGDPDFHVDNVRLVALAMNRAGLRTVNGRVLVDERFWIGWEGGSERKTKTASPRARAMAARLRDALDPGRWDARTRRLMAEAASRHAPETGVTPDFSGVSVRGGVGIHATAQDRSTTLEFVHRSNELIQLLKRFNTYSNNDIERLELSLGSAAQLSAHVTERWGLGRPRPTFETLSGLGTNRLTPLQVVHLLRRLEAACRDRGLTIEDVLPTVGCGPGTLELFRDLSAGSVVAKTGTLVKTDDGVAVLAGVAHTAAGDRFFCVAAPGAGRHLNRARRAQGEWLREVIERSGGARSRECGRDSGFSDDDARVSLNRAAGDAD